MRTLAIVPFSLMLALAAPAAAQTDQLQEAPQTDKCRVQTEQGAKQQPRGDNLTDELRLRRRAETARDLRSGEAGTG